MVGSLHCPYACKGCIACACDGIQNSCKSVAAHKKSSLEPLKRQSANIFRQYSGRCAPSRCDSGDTGLGRIESVLFRSWTVDSKCATRSFQCWRTCLRKSDFARFRSVLGGLSDRSFPIPCLLSERHRSKAAQSVRLVKALLDEMLSGS